MKNQPKSKERIRTYHWYIQPLTPDTNRVLAENLPEEDFLKEVPEPKAEGGAIENLWRSTSEFISYFRKSKASLGLKFRIFCQEGNGQIRLFPEALRRSRA